MARGTSLSKAVDMLRYELRETVDPATGRNSRDHRKHILQRTQEALYDEYDWAFLRVTHYAEVAAGQRYYDLPADMVFERVEEIAYRYNGLWLPLAYGIGPEHYNIYDSGEDFRTDPIARWAPYNEDAADQPQIEVWPIPSANGYLHIGTPHGEAAYVEGSNISGSGVLRFQGHRKLSPLIEDSDTLDLDDVLVVLNAAWETTENQALADKLLARFNRRKEALMNKQHKTSIHCFNTGRQYRAPRNRRYVVRTTVTR